MQNPTVTCIYNPSLGSLFSHSLPKLESAMFSKIPCLKRISGEQPRTTLGIDLWLYAYKYTHKHAYINIYHIHKDICIYGQTHVNTGKTEDGVNIASKLNRYTILECPEEPSIMGKALKSRRKYTAELSGTASSTVLSGNYP